MTDGAVSSRGSVEAVREAWTSAMLERPSFHLIFKGELLQSADMPAELGEKAAFASCKVRPDEISRLNLLTRWGFCLIETNLLFSLNTDCLKKGKTGICSVRTADSGDEHALTKMAQDNIPFSRFHMDPMIPGESANRLKGNWVRNFFNGMRGEQMLMAEVLGKPAGFIQVLEPSPDCCTIDLLAVDGAFRRRGVAGAMISALAAKMPAGARLQAGTQLVNSPSIALYQSLGFKLVSARYVFHYHQGSVT